MRYHAKDKPTGPGTFQWMYEEIEITTMPTNMLLVRVLIGKVKDMKRLEAALRDVPVVQGDAAWNCVIWARKALEKLKADGKALGTSQLDWQVVRDAAMKYVQEKKEQHRFDGQAPDGTFDTKKAPTFDLLLGREVMA